MNDEKELSVGGLRDERNRQRPQCRMSWVLLGTGKEGRWWGWGDEVRRNCSWVTARKFGWNSDCDRKPLEGVK